MRCIKSILIRNFRTHRKLKIRFSPRITCITGPSDHGKSNVIRAIRWVALNRPTGTSFIRWGKGQAKVRLSILRHATCRIRAKKRNLYRLDGEKLEAFGNDVPKPVADLLRMSDINFQLQHDPHFWFSLSPGEVSRQLNKIVNLDIIDKTLANLNASLTRAKAEVEVCQDRLKDANGRKKSLRYAKAMKAEVDRLIKLQQKRNRLERKVGTLGGIIETIQDCKRSLRRRKRIVQEARKDLDQLEALRRKCKEADWKYCEIGEAVCIAQSKHSRVRATQQRLDKVKNQFEKFRGKRCPLCNQKVKRL